MTTEINISPPNTLWKLADDVVRHLRATNGSFFQLTLDNSGEFELTTDGLEPVSETE